MVRLSLCVCVSFVLMAVTLSVVVCDVVGMGTTIALRPIQEVLVWSHRSPWGLWSVELPSSPYWLRFVGLVSFVGEMNRFSVEQVHVDISNTSVVMKGTWGG